MAVKAVVGERIDVRPTSSPTDTTSWVPGCAGGVPVARSGGRPPWRATSTTAGRHPVPRPDRTARDRGRGVARSFRHLAPRRRDQGGRGRRHRVRASRRAPASSSRSPPGVGVRDRKRVIEAVAGLRRRSCSVHVRPNAGLDDRVARLVAGCQAPTSRPPTPRPLWVDRPCRVRRLVRALPAARGSRRRHQTAGGRLRHGLRHRVPAAHPSDRQQWSQGAQQHAGGGPGRPRQPVGHRLGRRAATPPSPPSSARRRLPAVLREAGERGLEVALDYAPSARPTIPAHEHPEWFWRRPDGSIRHAENPPKKYQDIFPINLPERDADRAAVEGVPRRPALLDRRGRAGCSGSTIPTPSRWRSGPDHRAHPPRPPRRRLLCPRRSPGPR